jgi:Holliday junction resolvase RusA-like endonuclease
VSAPIVVQLRCVPPSVTAQQKRVDTRGRRPRFYHGARMKREEATWAALLRPHQPPAPMTGAIALYIRLVYPHLSATAKRDRGLLIPKRSKPDAGNAAKHLEDLLAVMRFIEDDKAVARLTVEKWHGPEDQVGITIQIAPLGA